MNKTVFIFFNGGGLTDDQWTNHPYEDKHINLLDKVREFGDVYSYTPAFYISDGSVGKFKESGKEYMFRLEDLNLINHCNKVESKVNHYSKYFLISHSRGWIFSQVFSSLFSDKIVGYINLDGGETYDRARIRVYGWDRDYTNIGNISNSNLLFIFNEIKRGVDVDKNIKFLNKWSKYYVYKQYSQLSLGFPDNFPIYILNNIYSNDEVNIKMKDYVETTLLDKVEYNAQYKGINNIECIWFVGFTHYFYFEKVDEIIEIITKVIKACETFKEIYFIRHGQTEWNKLGKTQGQEADIELNETGINEAVSTGKYLKKYRINDIDVDCVISSSMLRCQQTTQLIANELGFDSTNIIYDDNLKEVKKGNLSGLTGNDVPLKTLNELVGIELGKMEDPIEKYEIENPRESENFFQNIVSSNGLDIEGVENILDLTDRVTKFINQLRTINCKKIVVVSHSGLLEVLLKLIFNVNVLMKGNVKNGKNCSITYCTFKNNHFSMISPQNTEHLSLNYN